MHIRLNETYKFTKLKAKIYKDKISLQSRKVTNISINKNKILNKDEKIRNINIDHNKSIKNHINCISLINSAIFLNNC